MQKLSNWAVGFYNPIAAYTVGQVWANPAAPNTTAVKFADGAMAFKLLFTSGTVTQLPFLANSKSWQANIVLADPPSSTRQPQEVLLLQVDVAVCDDRNDALTGWVFGTFMYQARRDGSDTNRSAGSRGAYVGQRPNTRQPLRECSPRKPGSIGRLRNRRMLVGSAVWTVLSIIRSHHASPAMPAR